MLYHVWGQELAGTLKVTGVDGLLVSAAQYCLVFFRYGDLLSLLSLPVPEPYPSAGRLQAA
jgi:hypothetical protein